MSETGSSAPRSSWRDRIDLAVALLALITSAVSIWLSVTQGDDMARLVQAQSWPHVELRTGNFENGRPVIALGLRNGGVGPAKIVSLQVLVGDQPVSSSAELLRRCCAETPGALDGPGELVRAAGGNIITTPPAGIVLRPGDEIPFLQLERTEDNLAFWNRLDGERFKLRFEVCYCSVFDECWLSALSGLDAKPVARCPAIAVPYRQ